MSADRGTRRGQWRGSPRGRFGIRAFAGSVRGEEVDHEDQGLSALDHARCAAAAIAEMWGDGEAPTAADSHTHYALVPAGDHLPRSELEVERLVPVPRGVEFGAG